MAKESPSSLQPHLVLLNVLCHFQILDPIPLQLVLILVPPLDKDLDLDETSESCPGSCSASASLSECIRVAVMLWNDVKDIFHSLSFNLRILKLSEFRIKTSGSVVWWLMLTYDDESDQ
jgi:hypothetical protein